MAIARAFLAVVPPRGALDAVGRVVDAMRAREPAYRWAARDHWHVTMRFLGRVDDEAALVGAVADVTRAIAPVVVRLQGTGAFPTARRARVLWVGVGEGRGPVRGLAEAVGSVCGPPADEPVDDGRFTAHLTVARLRAPADVRSLLQLADGPLGPHWTADELVLLESRLGGPPPRYVPRARFSLSGEPDGL